MEEVIKRENHIIDATDKVLGRLATQVVDFVDMDDMGELPEISEKEIAAKPDKYYEATGRRKTAVARVRLFTRGEKQFLVNGKPYQEYFPLAQDQDTVTASMRKMKCLDKFKVTVIVRGGGRNAQ